ncbi:hypothetical protein [Bradyrhizobium mercantei]|uniref:hypothetical protein n=1 Tax=Bradyrhizobium mercantei TaxID=1904807 RepID=UPI000976F681|nr:hypothetical protein [Bradyrhizobium mercantei]
MTDSESGQDPRSETGQAARRRGASAGWLAVIAAGCTLFLFARAVRWTEGVTIDDSMTLLLGVLPFVFFYFFGSVAGRDRDSLFPIFSLAWIMTLTVFLVVRLTPLAYTMDASLRLVTARPELGRLISSICFSLLGTCIAIVFYRTRLWRDRSAAMVHLGAMWAFNALYVWTFVYILPPA